MRAVLSGDENAWERFVVVTADTVYGAASSVFPTDQCEKEALALFQGLRANQFAAIRPYDGRSSLNAYVALKLVDLLADRITSQFTIDSDAAWLAFERYFGSEIRRFVNHRFRLPPGSSVFEDGTTTEDKFQDVCEKLIENDYARIRNYDGKGSFTGYIRKLVRNLCEDLYRAMAGRRRLPEAVQRLGDLEQAVFKEIYWNRVTRDDVIQDFCARGFGKDDVNQALSVLEKAYRNTAPSVPRKHVSLDSDSKKQASLVKEISRESGDPESALIRTQDEGAMEQALSSLSVVISRLPQKAQLYLKFRYLDEPPLAPRDIAPLLKMPVKSLYKEREKWENLLLRELNEMGIEKFPTLSV